MITIERIRFDPADAIRCGDASRYNVNNIWADGIPPPDYGERLAATLTGRWAHHFHTWLGKLTISGPSLRWMKEASAQSYLGKFMHHYDDDLKQTVEDYQGEFPSPPGPGWFVRTEHVSLKEGCYGTGPYISLTSVLQSAVTSAYRQRAVRDDDDACVLYFFPWVEIDPDREFRVFVHLDSVTALCPQGGSSAMSGYVRKQMKSSRTLSGRRSSSSTITSRRGWHI